jgi:uncharacterized DUF497 family protein
MQGQGFEWDDAKAELNYRNHGVSFEQAIRAFRDAFAVEWVDDRQDYGEERWNLVGLADNMFLHVTYTEREDRIRIISARRALKHEQEHYYRQNSP